jgi:NAD(P)-dependent dehydrogenase (short-subunit alcohol dehydrogenase family)
MTTEGNGRALLDEASHEEQSVTQVKLGIPGGEAVASAAAEMLIPLKRIGTPQEAAGAMLLLASPYASFISGQVCCAFPPEDVILWNLRLPVAPVSLIAF